jgi:exonuclease VII small subunit
MANTIVQQITAELDTLQKELSQFKSTVGYLNDAKTHMAEASQTVTAAGQDFARRTAELKLAFNEVVSFKNKIEALLVKIDSVDFPERLDKIEFGFTGLLEIEEELSLQLKASITSLDDQINKIDFNKKHDELRKDVARLEKNNDQLISEIKSLDIPKKIETFKFSVNTKLENTAAELFSNTKKISEDTAKSITDLNIPVRLDKVDANIAGIMAAVQSIQSRIDNLERNILDKLKDIQNTNSQNNLSVTKLMEDSTKAISKRQKTLTFITWGIFALAGIAALALLKYRNII